MPSLVNLLTRPVFSVTHHMQGIGGVGGGGGWGVGLDAIIRGTWECP